MQLNKRKKGLIIKCLVCQKPFYIKLCRYKDNERRCSRKCRAIGQKGRPKTLEHRLKIGMAHKGRKPPQKTPEGIARIKAALTGKKRNLKISAEELSRRISAAQRGKPRPSRRGANSTLWRGGVSEDRHLIRQQAEYKNWRHSVFERDNYTCQICFKRGVYLEADHIKPFGLFPALRYELENGRTLCRPCHRNTPTWGKHSSTYTAEEREQLLNGN